MPKHEYKEQHFRDASAVLAAAAVAAAESEAEAASSGAGTSSSGAVSLNSHIPPAPPELVGMTTWYAATTNDIKRAGTALGEALAEVSQATGEAYAEVDALIQAYVAGDKKAKGKDLWLAELKYRRLCRCLLAIKARYLAGMAALFERYRRIEASRSDAISAAIDVLAQALAKCFDRVSARAILDSVRALHTHADFVRLVDEEVQARIRAMRAEAAARAAAAAAAATAAKDGPAGAQERDGHAAQQLGAYAAHGHPVKPASSHGHGPGARGSGSAGGSSGGGGSSEQAHHAHFTLDPAPAVVSPLASPLIVRVGLLLRQVGVMRSWKQCVGILTRDGHLHVFNTDDDLATHPELLASILNFNPHAVGHGSLNQGNAMLHLEAKPTTTGAGGSGAGSSSDGAEDSEDITEAAAAAAAKASAEAARAAAKPANVPLPPPALPSELMSSAAAFAANVTDMATPAVDPLALARKATAPPQASFVLSPTTKLAFAPSVHAHAFELSDSKGWFGGAKLLLRAMTQDDAVDWVVACNAVVDLTVA